MIIYSWLQYQQNFDCFLKTFQDGYWTLSSYALSACLKLTKANIELITDRAQYDFIESCKRGGLTLAVQRFASSSEGDEILKKDFKHLINTKLLKASQSKNISS